MLSHQTAAWRWGILDTEPRTIHVSTARDLAGLTDIRVHGRRRCGSLRHNGLPVTTAAQTLLDLASTLPFDALRRALAEADHKRILHPAELERSMGRGRPGAAALRRALSRHLPQLAETRSVLERRFLHLVERSGLPLPEVNARVEGLTVDALWRDAAMIVELDGHEAHDSRAAVERDHRRDLSLRGAGFVVLRYTWQQVHRDPERVVDDLRSALGHDR